MLPLVGSRVLILLVSGAIAIGGMGVNSLAKYSNMVQQKQIEHQEIINENIQELIEDYEYCEEVYIKNLIYENPELANEMTEEDLSEYKEECLDAYISQIDYRDNVDIDDITLNFMKRELPKEDMHWLNSKERIIKQYIKSKIF